MDWIEIRIETTTDGVEPVSGLILMAGIAGLVVDDPKDIQEYLAGPQAARWDYVDEGLLRDPERSPVVRAYVADNEQGERQWEDLRRSLLALKESDAAGLYGSLDWRRLRVREEDWANNWKAFFKPFAVGEKLVVKPSWERWERDDGRIVLEIDPGSSFGTGQHESTRLCLEVLEKYVIPGATMVDLGCGSGILAIAGLLFGAGHALCVDVEENALHTAKENLRKNKIAPERYTMYAGDLTAEPELRRRLASAERRADLVVANIVADVILGMAPYFTALLKPDGRLLVSGIIDEREAEVKAGLEQAGFAPIEARCAGGWCAILCGK